ncbi:hypothetical protein [Streptomyces sp. NPDC048636]|uniref:hypothetical protein n=1 Tax=Streptomyces sp. NPDC048636 TaxID=3155762 RepID=UPI0034439D61
MNRHGSLLDRLREDPRAAELATHPFDFDPGFYEHVEPVRLASGAALEGIGKDAGGGSFFLCGDGGDERPVLYADSEGSAGIVGTGLTEALRLRIGALCWGEALDTIARAGREFDERETAELLASLEAEYSEDCGLEDLAGDRAELVERLGLGPLPSASRLLELAREASALSPSYILLNEEGRPYDRL